MAEIIAWIVFAALTGCALAYTMPRRRLWRWLFIGGVVFCGPYPFRYLLELTRTQHPNETGGAFAEFLGLWVALTLIPGAYIYLPFLTGALVGVALSVLHSWWQRRKSENGE